jgi:adenylate cyclase
MVETNDVSTPSEPRDTANDQILRDALAERILGEHHSLTNAQTAEQSGLSLARAKRVWRALGFPDPGDAPAFGPADVEALTIIAATIDNDLLEEDIVLRLTRAVGHTMARLADWQVATLVDHVENEVETGRNDSRLESAIALAEMAGPGFERLLTHAWRRHLAAAAARLEAQGGTDSELLTTTMTVGFADLSRFTSLSNRLDDNELGSLVEGFENRVTDRVTAAEGRVIKTLGDAVLFIHADPEQAARVSLDVINVIAADDSMPSVRVGLATGSVISRLGDVFGPPVNMAARLSQVARSHRLLTDQETANALGDEFDKRILPPRMVRGFGSYSPVNVSVHRGFRHR